MLKFIRSLFSNDLLVELSEEQLSVRVFNSDIRYVDKPYMAVETLNGIKTVVSIGAIAKPLQSNSVDVINPFQHPRSFVADFSVAEKILQHAIQQTSKSFFISPAPRVVMHQLEKTEGGLTEIEEKVLRELAIGAGAREVLIYTGNKLSPKIESFDSIKSKIDN